MDIVLAGYIGLEKVLDIAKGNDESLKARFPEMFFKRIFEMENALDASFIEEELTRRDQSFISLGKGGLYRGLWDLGETFYSGISVYLKDVKVLQEVVELTEACDLNPYTSDSKGAVLIRTENGEELVKSLLALNIDSSVIGKTTKGNDRVVFYDENVLYLIPYKEES